MEFVLGFDFGGTKMAVAAADLSGRVLREAQLPTLPERGARQAFDRAVDAAGAIAGEIALDGVPPAGIGVSTMGVPLEDRVVMASNVPGWESLTIRRSLREAFHCDAIQMSNDVKAAARAELRWGALRGLDTALYLNLGTGIAVALIVDGRVVNGAHGAAGEIGCNLRHLHQEEGARDGRVPLEEFVGGGALLRRAQRRFGDTITMADVFAAADSAGEARSFVEETLEEVAFHVTNLAIALDPTRIAVAGGLMRSGAVILPWLNSHVQRFVPFPPEVVAGEFLLNGGLMGGIALGLQAAEAR